MSGRIEIAAGRFRAVLAPEWGGRMLRLSHAEAGELLYPLEADGFDPLRWPKGGAYPLFPYHGRIAGAAFPWEGQEVRLEPHPDASPHCLHGPAHKAAWEVTEREADAATLRHRHRPDRDWPWAFEAVQRFRLSDTGLEVRLRILNSDARAMPAGIGWHPYFAKAAELATDARSAWPHDGAGLPTGERQSPGNLRGGTLSLSDWSWVDLTLPAARLRIEASAALGQLVIHDPPAYTCVEPVSHLSNAPNLPVEPPYAMARLEPGAALEGEVRVSLV